MSPIERGYNKLTEQERRAASEAMLLLMAIAFIAGLILGLILGLVA